MSVCTGKNDDARLGQVKPLRCKPDWPRAAARWIAFWDRQATDRPCLDVKAPSGRDVAPVPAPENLEERWTDAEYVSRSWVGTLEGTYFGGEAVPSASFIMAGWTLGCGVDITFAETTIYHPVIIRSIHEPVKWRGGADDPWRGKLAKLLNRLLDLAAGRFFASYTCQVPANDVLYLMRGSGDFLEDLATDGEACRQRLLEILPRWLEDFEFVRRVVDGRQPHDHVWSWPGLWSPQFVMTTQSDMSCMISEAMFERYVVAELDVLGERYERLWYHVDGSGAKRHVKRLLERPYIKAIQYVPEGDIVPNGPAHMELYRQVQAAGRCLDLHVSRKENVEYLIRHLRPEGLVIRTGVGSIAEAEELLDHAVKWCGTHVGCGS